MERVTITKIDRREITTVKGPAQKVGIQTDKHGDKWLGSFVTKWNEKKLGALAEGQTLDIVVETSPDGKYLNFSFPGKHEFLEARVAVIEAKLGITSVTDIDDVNPDDIPF